MVGQVLAGRREVRCRQVVLQVGRIALDQLAPLFVPEEEGLLAIRVVGVRDEKRAADVEAVDVVVQLRTLSRRRLVLVLKAVPIERRVAVELP